MLDRPRHEELVEEIRATGARIKFITDGDVAGAIMAAREGTGIDLLLGIGGTPEGIIAACAMKCLDGVIQGRLWPTDDEERQRAIDAGHDLDRVLYTDDLVSGDDCFFVATGITDGELMQGVRYKAGGASTHSLVMRSRSGTIRSIHSEHKLCEAAGLRRRRLRALSRAPVIVVVGEALIDVVVDPDGDTTETPGARPLNVAVGLARLDVPATADQPGRRTTSAAGWWCST